jgi:hypothetical protein
LNWDIVDEMSTVNELTLSPAGTVAEPLVAGLEVPALAEDAADAEVDEDPEPVDEDEQPAATMAAAAATATRPSRGRGPNARWPCGREGRPPRPLLPSTIRYPFRHNAVGDADAGHR